ncbi:nuclear transport factor 2 family protein [Agromyces bauzanensis]
MSELTMPAAIEAFFDTTNRGDSEAFVAAFGDDAYLNDWGREFHGRNGVASWNETDNIGKQAHFEVHGIRQGRVAGQYLVTVTVSGNGYNGPGTFTFQLGDDGLISRFVIA